MVVARGAIDGDWGGGRSNVDRAMLVKVGLNQTRGGAARIATACCPSTACPTAGAVARKSSLVEKLNEFNLESVKSLILGTRSLLSGQKLPCSPFEGISQEITAAQGFVGLRAILKRVNAEAIPVNFPDSRGEHPNAAPGSKIFEANKPRLKRSRPILVDERQ
jgi:hypothetical protein